MSTAASTRQTPPQPLKFCLQHHKTLAMLHLMIPKGVVAAQTKPRSRAPKHRHQLQAAPYLPVPPPPEMPPAPAGHDVQRLVSIKIQTMHGSSMCASVMQSVHNKHLRGLWLPLCRPQGQSLISQAKAAAASLRMIAKPQSEQNGAEQTRLTSQETVEAREGIVEVVKLSTRCQAILAGDGGHKAVAVCRAATLGSTQLVTNTVVPAVPESLQRAASAHGRLWCKSHCSRQVGTNTSARRTCTACEGLLRHCIQLHR